MLHGLQLDPGSGVPLYRQLYEQLRILIESGGLRPGERLPSTRELAGLLGLNRATVSAAYAHLESDGLLRGHVGLGSFVREGALAPPPALDWDEVLEPAGQAGAMPALPEAASDGLISFATSRPAERLFPLEDVRLTCREVLSGPEAATILQLGSPMGYGPLREYLMAEERRVGVVREHDDILVTSGCQQALDLLQRVLVRPGDTVVVEDPVYPGLKGLLARAGARLVGIRVGTGGLELDALERVLAREKPRLLILTPNFQNPTGATLPLEARHAILPIARRSGAIVVENDIYGELRYQGDPLPTLKELDDSGDTILLRSFSKVAFPGLRVGWITGPRALLARLAVVKQWTDLHTDQLSQALLLRFAESGRLQAHKARIVAAGVRRLAAVLDACERCLPEGTHFTRPQGGMNIWLRLPEPLDAVELLARAQRENVTYLPGRYFEVTHHHPGGLRLSFAGLDPERIRTGIAILGQVFKGGMERVRDTRRREPAVAIV